MFNAIQGIVCNLILSFIILLIYTRAFFQTLISIFCVGYIMISVICIMVLNGWEMGVSESIGVVLLIGLSVDYVVHLASHFSSGSE